MTSHSKPRRQTPGIIPGVRSIFQPSASWRSQARSFAFVVYVSIVISCIVGAPLVILPFYMLQEATF